MFKIFSKFCQIIIAILIILLHTTVAHSEIKITNWDENINLTDSGKESTVIISAKIADLPKNYYQNGFSIGFDQGQRITIKEVKFDDLRAQYIFANNQLKIDFPKRKFNGDNIKISFSYQLFYNKLHKYLRNEAIYIPSAASGAQAQIIVNFPWNLESATLNKNITEYPNKFIYKNIVPKNGVLEIVKLTPVRSAWNISMKETIISNQNLTSATIKIPAYFKNSGVQNYNYIINSNPTNYSLNNNSSGDVIDYENLASNKIIVQISAIAYTGKAYKTAITRNPNDYLLVNEQDRIILEEILEKIKQDQSTANLPLYARIGNFVHQFIKYDLAWSGKNLTIGEIIEKKSGVCAEYAKLYNELVRMAGIPSLVVHGAAFGEYDKFERHAWNLIYYNNDWIYVDPTWDLMSGVVSASHIYILDGDSSDIEVEGRVRRGRDDLIQAAGLEINIDDELEINNVW